jgi:hypothetical protein
MAVCLWLVPGFRWGYSFSNLLEDWDCVEDLPLTAIASPYSFDHVSKEMEGEIKKNCSKWLIQSLEQFFLISPSISFET